MVDLFNVSNSLKIRQSEEPIEGQKTNQIEYRKNDFERSPHSDTVNFKGKDGAEKNNTGKIVGITAATLAIGATIYAGIHGKNILKQAEKETGFIDNIKTGYKNFFKKTEDTDLVKTAKEVKVKAEQEAKVKAEQEAKAKAEQEVEEKIEQEAKAKAEQEVEEKIEQEAKAKAEQEVEEKIEQEVRDKAKKETRGKTKGKINTSSNNSGSCTHRSHSSTSRSRNSYSNSHIDNTSGTGNNNSGAAQRTKNKQVISEQNTTNTTTIEEVKNINTENTPSTTRKMVSEELNGEPTSSQVKQYAGEIAYQAPTREEQEVINRLNKSNQEERAVLNSIGNNHTGATEQEIRNAITKTSSTPKEGIYNYTRNGNSYIIEVGKDGKVVKYTRTTGTQTTEVTDQDKIAKFLDKNPDALKFTQEECAEWQKIGEEMYEREKADQIKKADEIRKTVWEPKIEKNLSKKSAEESAEAFVEDFNRDRESLFSEITSTNRSISRARIDEYARKYGYEPVNKVVELNNPKETVTIIYEGLTEDITSDGRMLKKVLRHNPQTQAETYEYTDLNTRMMKRLLGEEEKRSQSYNRQYQLRQRQRQKVHV